MNELFGKLVINVFLIILKNELFNISWLKEKENSDNSDDSEEGLLIPGS